MNNICQRSYSCWEINFYFRNVSSDGPYARKQLRECDSLIEALLRVTHHVLNKQEKGKDCFDEAYEPRKFLLKFIVTSGDEYVGILHIVIEI